MSVLNQFIDPTAVHDGDLDRLFAVPVRQASEHGLCLESEGNQCLQVVAEVILSVVQGGVRHTGVLVRAGGGGGGGGFVGCVFHVSNLPQNACLTTPFPVFFSVSTHLSPHTRTHIPTHTRATQ